MKGLLLHAHCLLDHIGRRRMLMASQPSHAYVSFLTSCMCDHVPKKIASNIWIQAEATGRTDGLLLAGQTDSLDGWTNDVTN